MSHPPLTRRQFGFGAAALLLAGAGAPRALAQGATRSVTTVLGTYDIAARHGARIGAKVAALQYFPDEDAVRIRTGYMNQSQVLADLGGTTVDGAELGDNGLLAMENLAGVLADAAGIMVVDLGDDSPAALARHPIWQRLPAVQAGAVVTPKGNTNYGSVYTAIYTARAWDALFAKLA